MTGTMRGPNRRWWVVVAMSGIMILLTVDVFGVAVALPQIGKDHVDRDGARIGQPGAVSG